MSDQPAVPTTAAPAEGDGELQAMNAIVAALKPLTEEERRRVLEYVLGRFGALPLQPAVASVSAVSAVSSASASPSAPSSAVHDIRSLKEAKAPIQAATEAISQWKFKPLVLNGTAVKMEEIIDVDFQLPKEKKSTVSP